jgi:hypothetical protein
MLISVNISGEKCLSPKNVFLIPFVMREIQTEYDKFFWNIFHHEGREYKLSKSGQIKKEKKLFLWHSK